ncbi:hypothetical protein CsatB_023922 [Cannabis sativa]
MEFEDQEDHDEEMEMAASYDSLGNSGSGRVKMPSSGGVATAAAGAGEGVMSQSASQPRKPRYRECQKNHAVGMGGYALDGCGEFLAAGAEGSLDGLKCAACSCHRNFHRKETDSGGITADPYGGPLVPHHYPHPQLSPYYRTPTGYLHVAPHHRPLALPSTSGGGAGSHSREDQEDVSNPSGGGGSGFGFGSGSSSKKRFRTKFSQEQKDRMLALAERLGWRIQKQDEAVVQQFCNETGVRRQVLKVWMHNNKHTLGKKP